jgi:hypothetical protein
MPNSSRSTPAGKFELKSRLIALGDKKTSGGKLGTSAGREFLSQELAELDQILQERVDQLPK